MSTKQSPSLLGHWPLNGHAGDTVNRHPGAPRQVKWTAGPDGRARGAALFNGRDSVITVADAPELQLGGGDFSVAAWIRCARPMRGVFGDVLSKFDAERRCGLNLWVAGSSSGYNAMSDARHVHAGVDDGYMGAWEDCGHPGADNPLVTGLAVHQGALYAGASDATRPEDACRVYRWAGGRRWTDCGRLGKDPGHLSVMSMIVHDGALYAGTGIWNWRRAAEARQANPPEALTHVFRYEGGKRWRDLGQVGCGQRVLCMASFKGALYAGLDRGGEGRCYKWQNERWSDAGVLDEHDNFECLMPLGGVLYGASHTAIYRYEGGRRWTCIGRKPHDITQIHAFQVADGRLWVGTWPQGYVLRLEHDGTWTNTGLLGLAAGKPGVALINEINALGVHNGKLYAGVLPKAQVYRYERDGHWTLLDSLASRRSWDPQDLPSWMRVLALTSHRGCLFACTGTCMARAEDLDPDRTAGRVLCRQTGIVASHERDIGGDWTHVAAVRRNGALGLYINGVLSHRSSAPDGTHLDLGNAAPLRIGAGEQGAFDGAIGDVRLYGAALTSGQIRKIAAQPAS